MWRFIVGWGETFDISFDIKIDQWEQETRKCYGIVHFEDAHLYPGAFYCPDQTEGSIAFESKYIEASEASKVKIGTKYAVSKAIGIMTLAVSKEYPVFKELHKVYHVQMKQFRQRHVSNKLRRFVKVDGKLVDDYEIEDQTISGEIRFYVGDISESGAHIYNLKVTE